MASAKIKVEMYRKGIFKKQLRLRMKNKSMQSLEYEKRINTQNS
jgi:hypothetical protein